MMKEREAIPSYSHEKFWIYAQREFGFRAYGSENYVGGKIVRIRAMKGRGIIEDWLHLFFNILSMWMLVGCFTNRWL